jgi:hypothetical protein
LTWDFIPEAASSTAQNRNTDAVFEQEHLERSRHAALQRCTVIDN